MLLPSIGIIAGSGGSAGAYESIATVTVAAGGSSLVEFTSIPQNYQHLVIRGVARCAANTDRNLRLYFNNNTSNTGYYQHWVYGNGSSANAESNAVSPQIGYLPMSGDTASIFGVTVTELLDYSSTSKTKVVRTLGGWDGNGSNSGMAFLGSGAYYSNTNAITSLQIKMSNGANLAEFSSFALYGIKG